jgi:hypothetical protein
LASAKPEKQSVFQVDSSGVETKLLDASDNVLAHLFVGKTTTDFFSSYVRAADSNNVYVVEGYLKSVFDKGTRTWKDRTIFAFNKGDVTSITIKSEEEEIELQIDAESKWQMFRPVASPAKGEDVDSLLDTLSSLTTDDFAEAKDLTEYELDAPKSSIRAVLNDGSTEALLIGKEESGKHYVKREDTDTIFMLYTSRINQLIKKSEDLKDETAVAESDVESDSDDEGESETADEGEGE